EEGLLRPRDDQLPPDARGRDPHRGFPRGRGEAPVHHRRRRVRAARPHRRLHEEAPGARRRLRRPVQPAPRLLRQPGRRRRHVLRRPRSRRELALLLDRRRRQGRSRPFARRAVYPRARRVDRGRVLSRHRGARHAPRRGLRVRATARAGRPQRTRTQGGVAADIFAMLRTHDDVIVSRAALAESVERLRDRAKDLEDRGRIVLGARLARASGREILDEALRAFSGYHTTPVLEPRGPDLVLADTRLIFYYQNRLTSQGLAPDLLGQLHGGGALATSASRRGVSPLTGRTAT